jgi:RNA-splicing ligase RtcB
MSRKAARRNLSMDQFKRQMDGIVSRDVNQDHLDEAPNAYKDIDEVMENQRDLVIIEKKLTPVLNIKG